jgi:DNA polymerase-3 subunit beta
MNITVSQSDLNAALVAVRSAVETGRATHPILATVLVDATAGDAVSLSGYDLKLAITTTIAASVAAKGATAVPYGLLAPLVAKLPSDVAVTIAVSGSRVVLATAAGEYSLTALDPADWPALIEPSASSKPVTIPLLDLQAAITATAHAASRDESKQLLQGIHISLDPMGIQAAATDGHRLSVYGAAPLADTPAITIPASTLRELQHLDADITVTADNAYVRLATDHTVITSRILDGTYPDFAKLIPDSFTTTATVDRKALLNAVQRIAILADTHNNIIKLSIGDMLSVTADVELGNGSETLPITTTGKTVSFAVNAAYFQDALKAMPSQQVVLSANKPTTPVVIKPANADKMQTYLIMPVQVRE